MENFQKELNKLAAKYGVYVYGLIGYTGDPSDREGFPVCCYSCESEELDGNKHVAFTRQLHRHSVSVVNQFSARAAIYNTYLSLIHI